MLNFSSNIYYKYNRFFNTLLDKSFKFVSNREKNILVFYLTLILLLVEIDPILEKQSFKKDVFITCGNSYIKIIFALLVKFIAFYMQVFIIQVRIFSLEKTIMRCSINLKLAIFLALTNNFWANLLGFYKFTSIYILGKLEMGVWVKEEAWFGAKI